VARKDRNPSADLIERLKAQPASAGFFQAVRTLLRGARRRANRGMPIGADARLDEDPVRFRAAAGMRHAATEITDANFREVDGRPELTVAFMGLTGPSGVLPDHYTDFAVQRRRSRDFALIDFFDLFNHRSISLFYRAWAKYRLPVRYEEAQPALSDPFSRSLWAMAGLGLDSQRAALSDRYGDLLAMAGPLARRVRSAGALRRLLIALFEFPVEVKELEGRWIDVAENEQTRLGGGFTPNNPLAILGETAVVGGSVWDVQSRFRVRLGPLGLEDFRSFFTREGPRKALAETVRLAVGPAMDFDLQLVLKKTEVPNLSLGDPSRPAYLGQTSWLITRTPDRDRDDAVLTSVALEA
jgi:type VI secretion system protein ImpH